jgi:aspartate aminotransferase
MRRINPRTYKLRESPTRRIDVIKEKLSKEKKDIYLLSTGQPSVPPPIELRRYIAELLSEESMKYYGYTQSRGLPAIREAIVDDLKLLGGLDLDPDENIVVTAGGQEAMFSVLSAIIEDGDEVILTDPSYFGYKPLIDYFGGKIVYTGTSLDSGFQPDIEDLKEKVSKKTKAFVIVSPDNPTGRMLDHAVGRAICDLAAEYDFWIIIDEAYKTIVYEGQHFWFWNYAPEHVIGINTFSKDPGFPGWRLGYVYSDEEVVGAVKLLNEEVVYCPPVISQVAAAYYLRSRLREKFLPKVLEVYKERRDALADAVRRLLPEVRFMKAQGSMFMFMDLTPYLEKIGMGSIEFTEALLEEMGVALIAGSLFGSSFENYIRFSFVTEPVDRIIRAVELMAQFLS